MRSAPPHDALRKNFFIQKMLIPKKFFLGRSFRIHPHLQSYVYTDAHGIVGTLPSTRLGFCMGVVKGDDDQLPFIMPYPGYERGCVAMGVEPAVPADPPYPSGPADPATNTPEEGQA